MSVQAEQVAQPRQHLLRALVLDAVDAVGEGLPLQQLGVCARGLDELGLVRVEHAPRASAGESRDAGRSAAATSATMRCTRPASSSCCWSARSPSSTERAVEPKSATDWPSWRSPAPWNTLPAVWATA